MEARLTEDTVADIDAGPSAAREQDREFARNMITEIATVVGDFDVSSLDLARVGVCGNGPALHRRDVTLGLVTISAPAAADAFGAIAAHLCASDSGNIVRRAGDRCFASDGFWRTQSFALPARRAAAGRHPDGRGGSGHRSDAFSVLLDGLAMSNHSVADRVSQPAVSFRVEVMLRH